MMLFLAITLCTVHVHAGDQVIRTTPEHPFYAVGRGWIPAGRLEAGDVLIGRDGQRTSVGEVFDTGSYETVYNFRVADWHTYFVGCEAWGWDVWAHNQYTPVADTPEAKANYDAIFNPDSSSQQENFDVLRRHDAGNTQVQGAESGQIWNIPPGKSTKDIPLNDPTGDRIQELTDQAAAAWSPSHMSDAAKNAVGNAHADGEHWLGNLLTKQAKGRDIEDVVKEAVKSEFPDLVVVERGNAGLDIQDPASGISWDVMSGTESNRDDHAKREPNELFRMVTY